MHPITLLIPTYTSNGHSLDIIAKCNDKRSLVTLKTSYAITSRNGQYDICNGLQLESIESIKIDNKKCNYTDTKDGYIINNCTDAKDYSVRLEFENNELIKDYTEVEIIGECGQTKHTMKLSRQQTMTVDMCTIERVQIDRIYVVKNGDVLGCDFDESLGLVSITDCSPLRREAIVSSSYFRVIEMYLILVNIV